MKTLNKVIKWSILALVIEFAGFYYVDTVRFAEIKTFHVTKDETKKPQVKNIKDVEIPEKAKNVCVSFDGKFAAYIIDDAVTVINRETGKFIDVSLFKDTKATYISWLQDRNRMYIAQKGQNFVKFSSYDANKDVNIQWADDNGKDIRINLPNPKYEVKELAYSVNTNAFYANIGNSSRSIIYRSDAMKDIVKVKDLYTKVGQIGIMQLEDKFIYEDVLKKQLFIEGYPNIFKERIISNPCFLGADFDDVAYIGNRTGDVVTKIYYGELKSPISSWKNISLPTGISKENIIISPEGNIYVNDALNGNVLELKSNKKITYEGKLVRVHKNGISYIDGSTLKDTKISN